MSLLPQRKKSAEEIAKLRESLGVPGAPQKRNPRRNPKPPPLPRSRVETIVPAHHEATVVHAAEPNPPLAPAARHRSTTGPSRFTR